MHPSLQTMSDRLTYDDYCTIPDDGKRHEIIDGVHYMSPSPRLKHQLILGNLHLLIGQFLKENPIGSVIIAPMDVLLSDHDIVQPDLLFLSRNYAELRDEKNVQGAPELAIEILSEGNRRYDEVTKRDLYESAGISEYWILDPELDTIKIYQLDEEKYLRVALLSREAEDRLSSPLLPGFECSLDAVFG